MIRFFAITAALFIALSACNKPKPLTVIVDSHAGMKWEFAQSMAESALRQAHVTEGTYHAATAQEEVPGGVRISFCMTGTGLETKACEQYAVVKNEYADGSIIGSIWLEAKLAEKIEYKIRYGR